MVVKLYNTVTRRLEEFVPLKEKQVGFYVCGPTVYDYFHIGNARVFLVYDVVRRYLEYRGYQVTYVQNYTDIEDKMIRRAGEMGITVEELAEMFIQAYQEDARALGIRDADFHPRATEHVPEIIGIIERLIARGLAYPVQGDVYYDTLAFPGYGKLSGQDREELEAGARVEVDPRKKHPMDFALWKEAREGEPGWESPWGYGRPGWHIECSAMSMKYLGETLDIHAGGPDLVFPHHENEVAQSEGATGKPFVRYWMHAGYLNIQQQKMSKSLGNILTIRELRQRIDPRVIRFFMLSAHYRSPINFSLDLLDQAAAGLERLHTVVDNLQEAQGRLDPGEAGGLTPGDREMLQEVETYREKFLTSMDNDFNTADALAALFELTRETNIYLQGRDRHREVIQGILDTFRELGGILGFFAPEKKEGLPPVWSELIAQRQEARKNKDWATADRIRDRLAKEGITLEDTPQGVRWHRKK